MTALEALQRAPLFKDFSAGGLETLAEMAHERTIPAGSPLFVEGMVGESLFVVVAGTVRVVQRAGGEEQDLATLGAGEHLGDLGLLARTVRLVSAVAGPECRVLELTRREFFKKAQDKPVTCLKLAAVIAGELARRVGESKEALRELAARKT
ncbi:MAG TPA: cyclic nucleotide-binding domain-containing protein [Anaeromyxobacteraceae bacterium]